MVTLLVLAISLKTSAQLIVSLILPINAGLKKLYQRTNCLLVASGGYRTSHQHRNAPLGP